LEGKGKDPPKKKNRFTLQFFCQSGGVFGAGVGVRMESKVKNFSIYFPGSAKAIENVESRGVGVLCWPLKTDLRSSFLSLIERVNLRK